MLAVRIHALCFASSSGLLRRLGACLWPVTPPMALYALLLPCRMGACERDRQIKKGRMPHLGTADLNSLGACRALPAKCEHA